MVQDDPLAYLRGEISEEEVRRKVASYRCIRVFVESVGDGATGSPLLTPQSRQVIGCALALKSEWGAHLEGILVLTAGEAPKEIGFFGMDRIYIFQVREGVSPKQLCEPLYGFLSSLAVGFTIFPPGRFSFDVAPRLAQRFGTGLVVNATSFFLNPSDQVLEITHPVFLGRMLETVAVSQGRLPIAVVEEGVFGEALADRKEASPIQEVK